MQCIHICYTVVLYADVSRLSVYIEINRINVSDARVSKNYYNPYFVQKAFKSIQ